MADSRIIESIENECEFIAYLQTLPDAQLQERLHILRAKRAAAWKDKNEQTLALLEVWERQVIKARNVHLRSRKISERRHI